MLPAQARLRSSSLIADTVKRGTSARKRYLVVHFLSAPSTADATPRVAFAVNKAVGGSVVRNQVVRRLRHVVNGHLPDLPRGCTMVVRALPAAATASSADFDRDLSTLLRQVVP